MNFRIFLAEMYTPMFIKKRELKNLFQIAASAFVCEAPSLNGLSYDDCVHRFALFTKTFVDQASNRDGEVGVIQDRLFQQAYEYGTLLRKRFRITTMAEVMRAGRILYHAIGIEFRGTDLGSIEIAECFFSRYYAPATCRIISSLDAGIMAGLSDGKLLTFSQRITEGFESCKAQMSMKEVVA
jgi:hypothetical protein